MLNSALQFHEDQRFLVDTYDWFTEKRFGHMDKWGYMEPRSKSDIVRGAELWDIWEKQASQSDNMLKRQGHIIQNQINDIVKLTTTCNTLIDLGPGGLSAVTKNTLPFINRYKENLKDVIFVDVTEHAAIAAKNYIQSLKNNVDASYINSDFFSPELKIKNNGNAVALMMGGTIGNFEASPNTSQAVNLMAKRIIKLQSALPQGTVIFIGLEATQNPDLLYESYNHKAHIEFEINMMHAIKRDVLIEEDGFNPYAWKYSMQWYPEAHQFCHIAEATELQRFNLLGQEIRIPKGKQLIIDNSFKFPALAMQRSAQVAKVEYLKPFTDPEGRMLIHAIQL